MQWKRLFLHPFLAHLPILLAGHIMKKYFKTPIVHSSSSSYFIFSLSCLTSFIVEVVECNIINKHHHSSSPSFWETEKEGNWLPPSPIPRLFLITSTFGCSSITALDNFIHPVTAVIQMHPDLTIIVYLKQLGNAIELEGVIEKVSSYHSMQGNEKNANIKRSREKPVRTMERETSLGILPFYRLFVCRWQQWELMKQQLSHNWLLFQCLVGRYQVKLATC